VTCALLASVALCALSSGRRLAQHRLAFQLSNVGRGIYLARDCGHQRWRERSFDGVDK